MRAFRILAWYLGVLVAFGVAACGFATSEYVSVCYNDAQEEVPCCGPAGEKYACPPDAGDDADVDAGDDVDASDDDGGPEAGPDASSLVCPGQCVPSGGGGWGDTPSFVWMGKETDPPAPPLPGMAWVTWVDVVFAEPVCPACSCAPPDVGCTMPSSWAANSTACQDLPSPYITPFDAPIGWDGSCTAANPIPGGAMCEGGPCVRSLSVEPPVVAPCVAEPAIPPEGQPLPPPVRTKVIEYSPAQIGACEGGIDRCVMKTPPGYRLCLVAYGPLAAQTCPEAWPERHDGWKNVAEQRFCSACSCGPPEGGFCEVRVEAFADDACGNERGSLVLTSSEGGKCVDLTSGTALAGKTAEVLSSGPGTCQPNGGEIIGEPLTEVPVTYCCVPELVPPP